MFDFTGPTTVNITIQGVTAEQVAAIVAEQLATQTATLEAVIMSQFTDLKDAVAALFADVTAKLEQLQAAIDNAQTASFLTAEDQAVLDDIKNLVATKATEIGDANGDGTPAPAETPAA